MKEEEASLREMADRLGFKLTKTRVLRPKNAAEVGTVGDDLLIGGAEIARELGIDTRKFYRMADNGLFEDAIKKIGHRTYTASKRKLRIVLNLCDDEPASAA
jgi:hypothetical protein